MYSVNNEGSKYYSIAEKFKALWTLRMIPMYHNNVDLKQVLELCRIVLWMNRPAQLSMQQSVADML